MCLLSLRPLEAFGIDVKSSLSTVLQALRLNSDVSSILGGGVGVRTRILIGTLDSTDPFKTQGSLEYVLVIYI